MTIPKLNCIVCDYMDDCTNFIDKDKPICLNCLGIEKGTGTDITLILKRIKGIKNKGTEIAPEYYIRLIIDIMKYGGLTEYDIIRFLKYFTKESKQINIS